MGSGSSFSFESDFSHPSKVAKIKNAKKRDIKYVYFAKTEVHHWFCDYILKKLK